MRSTFVVGRLTPRSTEMVWVKKRGGESPFPGPWTLRAIVRRPMERVEEPTPGATIH